MKIVRPGEIMFVLALANVALMVQAVPYTVSGGSSGGYMAQQMHIAYSASVAGAAIVAAGPYHCSMGSLSRVQTACTVNPWLINLPSSVTAATTYATDGAIDPISGLNNDKVFVFSGTSDQRVLQAVVQETISFYQELVPTINITTMLDIPANHGWVTKLEGNPCWYLGPPYVVACGVDLSGIIYSTLYGTPVAKGNFNSSHLFMFDQSDYGDVWQAGMSTRGFIYANDFCRSNPVKCTLHVNFHGCEQSYQTLGLVYIEEMGLGEWAETNQVIIMFPQAMETINNPEGCWDFWGYTGSNFEVKAGLQPTIIQKMAQDYLNIAQNLG
ncbi:hypothetical protein SteCoe_3130 [Stentor coeruleus]|uniref:Uncharacterized protein n=1 Tax=Stentor coeruleus TaxID=5963 RepID=A0A1R2CXS3_9CILI|nr:hypothetical protein SteCoe_3130 [Stentor coeruleus]